MKKLKIIRGNLATPLRVTGNLIYSDNDHHRERLSSYDTISNRKIKDMIGVFKVL